MANRGRGVRIPGAHYHKFVTDGAKRSRKCVHCGQVQVKEKGRWVSR